MEIKTTTKEIFDTKANYKGYLLKIQASFDERKFSGTYIIDKVEEDKIYLYNIFSNKIIDISIDDFKKIREDYVVGDKVNKITLVDIKI